MSFTFLSGRRAATYGEFSTSPASSR
uniref:Uncharacterized protein n=1 Tax=Anguilla anguilla TaxID=7936 RepID=A0A0E9RQZ7_ANGAN